MGLVNILEHQNKASIGDYIKLPWVFSRPIEKIILSLFFMIGFYSTLIFLWRMFVA